MYLIFSFIEKKNVLCRDKTVKQEVFCVLEFNKKVTIIKKKIIIKEFVHLYLNSYSIQKALYCM